MRLILSLIFAFFILTSTAQADSPSKKGFVSASVFNEANGNHSGLELSLLAKSSSYFATRISGVLYSEKEAIKVHDIYGGFSATAYFHPNLQYLNPYLGLGLFVGDTFNCSDNDEKDGTCNEDIVLAAYPEFGIGINIGKLHVFPFIRRYFDTNSHASTTSAYGVHIGINIE